MKILILLLGVLIFLAGCTTQLENPYYCEKDSDCEVKNIGNCCGYFPKCVNKAHTPDLEAVQRECEEKQLASICGFPDITHCECEENKCIIMQGEKIV